jgi:hypothetical protein
MNSLARRTILVEDRRREGELHVYRRRRNLTYHRTSRCFFISTSDARDLALYEEPKPGTRVMRDLPGKGKPTRRPICLRPGRKLRFFITVVPAVPSLFSPPNARVQVRQTSYAGSADVSPPEEQQQIARHFEREPQAWWI